MEKKKLKFIFMALMAWGEGISGGDKISIELARRWSKRFPVTIYLWEEGYRMYMRQNLDPKIIKFKIINMNPWKNMGFFINYVARILVGVVLALRMTLENEKSTIVYCATEFWMDCLPGFILKFRFPHITLVTTWFQTAPNPLVGFKEGNRAAAYRFRALVYWLVQLPIKPLIKKYSCFVLVNNEDERKEFPEMERKRKIIVVLGAVDQVMIRDYLSKIKSKERIYDGVFQGRFHPQKGVVELIDIWKLVVDQKKEAKLALIGDGPLMDKVKEKINRLKLQKNIKLFGYIFDGIKKYQIFAQSRIVLHPAFFDSGGMASLEAMAVGLPAIGFNLAAYQSYYPKGMIKVPINDINAFSQSIIELLRNKDLYLKMNNQAKDMISQNWSWDKRAEEVLSYIK